MFGEGWLYNDGTKHELESVRTTDRSGGIVARVFRLTIEALC